LRPPPLSPPPSKPRPWPPQGNLSPSVASRPILLLQWCSCLTSCYDLYIMSSWVRWLLPKFFHDLYLFDWLVLFSECALKKEAHLEDSQKIVINNKNLLRACVDTEQH
jgi:hypothetical protein